MTIFNMLIIHPATMKQTQMPFPRTTYYQRILLIPSKFHPQRISKINKFPVERVRVVVRHHIHQPIETTRRGPDKDPRPARTPLDGSGKEGIDSFAAATIRGAGNNACIALIVNCGSKAKGIRPNLTVQLSPG